MNTYISTPIPMGKRGTSIDWTHYHTRCKERLGYVPRGPLNAVEAEKLGFTAAAAAMTGSDRRTNKRLVNKKHRDRDDYDDLMLRDTYDLSD